MDPPDRNISDPADDVPPEVSTEYTHNGVPGSESCLAHRQGRRMDMSAFHPCFSPRRQHP
jgi:hypothetical protein